MLIDESMLVRAVKTEQMNFLYCLYAFNKNYEVDTGDCASDHSDGGAAPSVSDEDDAVEKYRTFTYDSLLKMIASYCKDNDGIERRVKAVAQWKLSSSENFLKSMLINRQDMVAAEYGKYYLDKVDDNLLKFAIDNANSVFIKFAFRKGLFSGAMLHKKEMISFLLGKLKGFS